MNSKNTKMTTVVFEKIVRNGSVSSKKKKAVRLEDDQWSDSSDDDRCYHQLCDVVGADLKHLHVHVHVYWWCNTTLQ